MEPCTRLNNEKPRKTPTEELVKLPFKEAVQVMLDEDPEFRAAVEEHSRRMDYFFMECVKARHRAKLTQKDIAERMGTTESAVSRLESYYPGRNHIPKLDTLQKYAKALGCRLVLKLEPANKKSRRKTR
jgi:ribosome-binding protein aMBF1 (putative translation factor)